MKQIRIGSTVNVKDRSGTLPANTLQYWKGEIVGIHNSGTIVTIEGMDNRNSALYVDMLELRDNELWEK